MRLSWLDTSQSIFYSIVLHVIVAVLLLFSFSMPMKTPQAPSGPVGEVIDAVAIDERAVQQEIERLQQQEHQKLEAEREREQRLREAEQMAEQLRQQRESEEQKLQELQRQKEAERERRELEEQRLAQLEEQRREAELEAARIRQEAEAEAERKRQEAEEAERRRQQAEAEAERKRQEAAEAERKRQEEEERRRREEEERKRQEEEERRKREAEEALQQQLAAEEAERRAAAAAAQSEQDQRDANRFIGIIQRQIESNFNIQGLPSGLSASLAIRLAPNGDVIDVTISRSSGNNLFDQRALIAVQRSSPLRVPEDTDQFERLGFRQFTLRFEPQI
jgi:colicin import membrane protein